MRGARRRFGRVLGLACLIATAVCANGTVAEGIAANGTAGLADRLRLSEAAAPERLRLRIHAQALAAGALPPRGLARMRADMVRQGHYFDGGPPALVARDAVMAPMLAWDGNINGGVLQDRFVFNGLTFEAAPGVRAKAGLVAGGSVAGVTRHAWQTGRLIELRGAAELGWSPEHRIGRADAMVSACSQNHLRGWTFLDLCGTAARYWRELDQGTAYQRSAGIVQVLAADRSAHQLELRASRLTGSGQDQTRLSLSAESIWTHLASRAELTLGQPREGATLLDYRLDGGITWLMGERPVSLDLHSQILQGGAFLGVPRRDRVSGISLSTRLRPGASLRVGVVDSRSTAGIANYRQVTLDLRLDRLR